MRTPLMRLFTVAAVLFALVAIGWSTFTVVDLLALRTYHTTRTFPAVGTLDLQTGDAAVTVIPDATGQIVVDRTVHRGLVHVSDDDAVSGGRLVVNDGCRRPFSWHCSMTITIHTPRQIDVIGNLGDGDLDDRGTTGRIDLVGGDGDVSLSQVTGPVTLRVADGDVDATGLDAPTVSVSGGDGDLHLALANAPDQLTFNTGDGDIDACVPAGGPPYAVDARHGDGQLSNQLPTDPTASRTLVVRAGDGDISLHTC